VNLTSVAALVVSYATLNANQVFEVRAGNGCNATTGTVLGDFTMPTTASWTGYTQATLNFATSLNLITSLCLVGKSSNTMDVMNLQWFTLASGSGTQSGTGPTCHDGIQNEGETGVDCGGPCPACPTGSNPGTLQAVNATITGGFNDGGSGVVLNSATSSLCWSNVNMGGNTSASLSYGNGEPPGDTLQLTFKGTNIGSAFPITSTGGWNTFTTGSTSFAAQSGSETLCLQVGTYSGWVAKVVSLTVGTTAGSPPPPSCTPKTCASLGDNCGSVSDGCGGTLSCGSCTSPQTCGGGGTANVCGGGGGTASCAAAYAQSNCPAYYQGITVSSGGHNWLCSNGNCANCGGYASCAPGGSGCPWGVVWTDQGACH
jgi:hypothetical protein